MADWSVHVSAGTVNQLVGNLGCDAGIGGGNELFTALFHRESAKALEEGMRIDYQWRYLLGHSGSLIFKAGKYLANGAGGKVNYLHCG